MKVLVVGYACDPYGGSEPGVGWAAVKRIALEHEVFVLTDIHSRAGWERAREVGEIPENIQVRFLRDRSACSENRFLAHLQSWMNYRAFNGKVLTAARNWNAEAGFDLCHQVTIASWRMPSPLWKLPVPFVWGPIGGAGYIPGPFRSMLSPSARAFERLRDLNTSHALRSRAFQDCIANASTVFAANEETEALLHPFRKNRPLIRLPIVSISDQKAESFGRVRAPRSESGPLRLFAGGNIEGRKGVSLALKALSRVAENGVDFRYTIAGGGPEIPGLTALSESLGLGDRVQFHPGYRGDDYIEALGRSHVYFLPSFRESTPVTLLEAYLAGCYPVVADTSAQGEIVRLFGGRAISAENPESMVEGLAEAVVWCDSNRHEIHRLGDIAAAKVAEHFSSARYDSAIEEAYRVAAETRD